MGFLFAACVSTEQIINFAREVLRMIIDLTQMQPDETGTIIEVRGGLGFARRLQGLGLRPGKKITKVSSHFWGGPQTVAVDNLQVAVGFGMAKRIFIKVDK